MHTKSLDLPFSSILARMDCLLHLGIQDRKTKPLLILVDL